MAQSSGIAKIQKGMKMTERGRQTTEEGLRLRDEGICEAFQAGLPVSEIEEVAELSRPRVYQVLGPLARKTPAPS